MVGKREVSMTANRAYILAYLKLVKNRSMLLTIVVLFIDPMKYPFQQFAGGD